MINTKGYIRIDSKIRKEKAQLAKRRKSAKKVRLHLQKHESEKLKYQLDTVKKAFKVNSINDLIGTANNLINQNKQFKTQLAQFNQQNQPPQQPNQSNNNDGF